MSPTPSSPASPPIQKGLEGVVASETRLSDVDGVGCRLIYVGYSIDELVGKASYEEVAFLLLNGHLPAREELRGWTQQLASQRALPAEVLQAMQMLPYGEPMAYLRTVISLIGLGDASAERLDPERLKAQSISLVAKTPTIIATFERLRKKQPMLGPRPDLGLAANFLYMLTGDVPSQDAAEAMDAYFVLLAEHGLNASTFAARTTVATQSDLYSGITAAIGTLKGPLHGAANTKAMEMLVEIGSPDRVEAYVQKTLQDHKRFMGFGHRVYKGEDPRAKHLRKVSQHLAQLNGETRWFDISERLKEAVWQAKKLNINVDFYSASLLYYLRIPAELFTTLFACARMAGWCAHIIEQLADNRLIRPLALYVGPRDLKFAPIDQRSA
ncbi:MAG TPA: citrate synthase [Candidatus Omnitrophica bacterium]|nr:MAG: hypothetical protein A2Z92_05205 [Omnitrophica WOR_2 bacterium GWA2_63_20]OGX16841.1 MAG: hypothetical protein A2105_02585 [Omnitrophica WOR_2 bacterium GWF2_63_9]OGX35123.1 MAG: hypothetical protein A3B73_02075 [Omnitrophica WOR_2 bacterium RIFCSPHIGHO2_02_FULL_63_39]OGX45594.1 MAG: hypothetical protein A3I71_01940 [Omnitrophica WOR_2 bacterium RIFCSPLOWO2_02_FULL_63_16]OGX48476.1 MAG: hypothetical protein A3G88_06690 [Omnitrophica WOR_2 bacterium RIFCSPLOWO2_12_FULL_63_16]HBH97702.1 